MMRIAVFTLRVYDSGHEELARCISISQCDCSLHSSSTSCGIELRQFSSGGLKPMLDAP
ncbi:hypothetical protein M758_2G014300 [Ceratodon purpureus]|nr:hypothetical protein M758_2G014300 [Ceratodon purpureus]